MRTNPGESFDDDNDGGEVTEDDIFSVLDSSSSFFSSSSLLSFSPQLGFSSFNGIRSNTAVDIGTKSDFVRSFIKEFPNSSVIKISVITPHRSSRSLTPLRYTKGAHACCDSTEEDEEEEEEEEDEDEEEEEEEEEDEEEEEE